MKIAFFDSGIGGLSVLREAKKLIPNASFIYYADSKNAPYGTKTPENVMELTLSAVEILAQHDIEALVIACNTATAIAAKKLREHYDFPIIGMEPAVKPACKTVIGKKIVVTATSLTLKEQKLNSLIQSLSIDEQVDKINLDKLVTFAERFEFDGPEVTLYLQSQLKSIHHKTHGAVVLGCTHFIFYKQIIQNILGSEISVIDGNLGTAKHLESYFRGTINTYSEQSIVFFLSGKRPSQKKREEFMSIVNI